METDGPAAKRPKIDEENGTQPIDLNDAAQDTKQSTESESAKIVSSTEKESVQPSDDTNAESQAPDTSNSDDKEPERTGEKESCAGSVESQDTEACEKVKAEQEAGPAERTAALREEEAGITEYISKHEGFSGVIKQRYSDFLVNEIDLEGNKVRFTENCLPAPEEKPEVCCAGYLTDEQVEELEELVDSEDPSSHVTLDADDDKKTRSRMHLMIRENFPSLDSSTENQFGQKVIKVVKKARKQGKHQRREAWPQGRGDFCHFVLYKENKDTMEAMNLVSKYMRMKPGSFTYAGTKDRRAKTSQEISVYRVTAERLHAVNKQLRNIVLGNFRYTKKPLKLGELTGNHFVIILRNATCTQEQIEQAALSLKTMGFINYYGMQRFGTTTIPTHHVGKKMLLGEWAEAIDLILKPRPGEQEEIAESRKVWMETKDARKALDRMGRRHGIERHLLTGLSKRGIQDPLGSLSMIPRNMRLMYIHSYQSYVWNLMASRRLRDLGMKSVAGDLVSKEITDVSAEDVEDSPDRRRVTPTILEEKDVDQYTIHDVLLPLPGYDVIYPQNKVGDWYKEFLEEDGMDFKNPKHKVKDYALPGAYRPVVLKPKDFSWELFGYDDVTIPLANSDWDVMNGDKEPESVEGGKFKALKLEFSLPSSTYATMVIREVLKSDTSAAHQSTLNVT